MNSQSPFSGLALAVACASLWTASLPAATTNVVTLSGTSYSPSSLMLTAGDVIIFKNTSGFHSATCEADPACGSHGLASSPWSLTNQFTVPGTYRYRCLQHSSSFSSGMNFSVTVLPGDSHVVTLTDTQFTPATLTIPTGDTVLFKNTSGTHSATCEQGDPNCSSHGLQSSPWNFAHTFTVPGTYHYRCLQHSSDFSSGMVMTLTVEPPPAVPATLSDARLQDGEFQFSVHGTPGRAHVVEGADDFSNWTPLKTNTPPDGIFGFAEPVSLFRRYYRVRQ